MSYGRAVGVANVFNDNYFKIDPQRRFALMSTWDCSPKNVIVDFCDNKFWLRAKQTRLNYKLNNCAVE